MVVGELGGWIICWYFVLFRFKRVIELGLGYGLVGLVIVIVLEVLEVVILDGNS